MILMWDNIKSFERHLETMLEFRKSHHEIPAANIEALKDMPVPIDIRPPHETGLVKKITDKHGNMIFTPIWQITPTKDSRN
jgi:hypothetical protein